MEVSRNTIKTFYLLLFSLFFYTNLIAQKAEILIEAEINPEYPGGEFAMNKYLEENLVYPVFCDKNNIGGRAVVKFRVASSGYVDTAYMIQSPHELISEECIRLMKAMPRWSPGRQAGKVVPVYFSIPFVFTPGNNSEFPNKYEEYYRLKINAIDSMILNEKQTKASVLKFILLTTEEFYHYENIALTQPSLFPNKNLNILSNTQFLSTYKKYFTYKNIQIDSIKNILNDSNFCINDSETIQTLNKFKLFINREMKCINRLENIAPFWRSSLSFHPIYNNWYMNDSFTQKYDSYYLNKTVNFLLFIDMPSYNITSGNLKNVGYDHSINFNLGIGFCYKKLTFKLAAGVIGGNNANYHVKFKDNLVKANISSATLYSLQIDYRYFYNKKWSYFVNGAIGKTHLNQYTETLEKNVSKVEVSNEIPYFKLGHTISYRLNPIIFFTLNTNISYLNHQSNAGNDLSGMLYQIGVGVGYWGNKKW
ncbi:MAG: energy transducer TonB [Bacteroidia bacterium]